MSRNQRDRIRRVVVARSVSGHLELGLLLALGGGRPDGHDPEPVLERSEPGLELGSVLDSDGRSGLAGLGVGVGQGVDSDGEGGLGGDHSGHLSLELLGGLPDEGGL